MELSNQNRQILDEADTDSLRAHYYNADPGDSWCQGETGQYIRRRLGLGIAARVAVAWQRFTRLLASVL